MAHDVKLGAILDGSEHRDAIHVAIAPVIAVEHLLPGDHVGLVDDTEHVGKTLPGITPIGIIDPFLRTQVQAGELALETPDEKRDRLLRAKLDRGAHVPKPDSTRTLRRVV